MSSKRIEIFKKALNHFKKASLSLKISLKYLLKPASHSQKKPPSICRIATMASLPLGFGKGPQGIS
jgi:hypothetical protein